jgi:hypothetical protein
MFLINLDKKISIIHYNDNLIIKNRYSHVLLDVSKNIKSFMIFNPKFLKLFTVCIKNDLFFYKHLNSITKGVFNFFYKKLNLIGIGFRGWVTKKKKFTLKFGFSKYIVLKIPKEVIIFFLRPTLIIVKGPDKEITNFIASRIRILKRVDIYKGKGILYENESIQLKAGKQK